jgi:hypothetical protein
MKVLCCLVTYLLIATSSYSGSAPTEKHVKREIATTPDDTSLPYMLVPYRIKNLWGFSDLKGNMKITPQYDDVKQIKYYWTDGSSFQSVMVVSKGANIFAINHHNDVVVPPDGNFDDISLDEYYYSVATITKQGKKGVFYNNKQIIPCQYSSIEREKNLSFRVLADGKSGIINSKGKIVVPVEYYGMHIKGEDKEHVTWIAGKANNVKNDFQDDLVVDPRKQEMHTYNISGMSPPQLNLLPGQEDTIIKNIRKIYPNATMDNNYSYIIYVNKNGKWGIFNVLKNKLTVPCEYDELKAENNTQPQIAIRAKKGMLYGYIDEDNNILAPLIFNAAGKVYNNFILRQGTKVGMLTGGLQYIPPNYLSIKVSDDVFDAKTATTQFFLKVITASGQKGYINSNGFEYFKD